VDDSIKGIVLLACTLAIGLSPASGQGDQEIQEGVERALRAYALTAIESSAQNATIVLTGSVNLCRDRLLAVQTVGQIHGAKAIDDRIHVCGPRVSDDQLKDQVDRIIAARIHRLGGFGFGSMTARLKDGVVTLTGTAATKLAEPAIAAIASLTGVTNSVDHVGRVPDYDANWHSNRLGFATSWR
jgi:osmotically-inducible protein OsmY